MAQKRKTFIQFTLFSFLPLILFLSFLPSSKVPAAPPQVTVEGEFQMDSQMILLPTGERGQSGFSIHHLSGLLKGQINPNLGFTLESTVKSPNRTDSGELTASLSKAFVQLFLMTPTIPPSLASDEIQAGYLSNPWSDAYTSIWAYSNIGTGTSPNSLGSLLEKFGYMSSADMGMQWIHRFSNLSLYLSLFNGLNSIAPLEEYRMSKDFQITLLYEGGGPPSLPGSDASPTNSLSGWQGPPIEVPTTESELKVLKREPDSITRSRENLSHSQEETGFRAGLSLRLGSYDNLNAQTNLRQHISAYVLLPLASWLHWNVEVLWGKDPVDGLIALEAADKANLSDWGGETATTKALSTGLTGQVFSHWSYFLKFSYLNPVSESPDAQDKGIRTGLWGIEYAFNENLRILGGESSTFYEPQQASSFDSPHQARNKDTIFISTIASF